MTLLTVTHGRAECATRSIEVDAVKVFGRFSHAGPHRHDGMRKAAAETRERLRERKIMRRRWGLAESPPPAAFVDSLRLSARAARRRVRTRLQPAIDRRAPIDKPRARAPSDSG